MEMTLRFYLGISRVLEFFLKQDYLNNLNIFKSESKVKNPIVEKVFHKLQVRDWFIIPSISRSGGFYIAWY